MKTYYHHCEEERGWRSHPWDYALTNPENKYYDFRERADLIPKVLEDFRPWGHQLAIQVFYELLRWFWSWGDDEHETFANLHRTIQNLRAALEATGRAWIADNEHESKRGIQ